jgi:hypothetical protein
MQAMTAPPVSPASTLMSEPVEAPGVWARALVRLRVDPLHRAWSKVAIQAEATSLYRARRPYAL